MDIYPTGQCSNTKMLTTSQICHFTIDIVFAVGFNVDDFKVSISIQDNIEKILQICKPTISIGSNYLVQSDVQSRLSSEENTSQVIFFLN
jgi:hypothetical protein